MYQTAFVENGPAALILLPHPYPDSLGVRIQTDTPQGGILTLMNMKNIEERLPADTFLRIHRSYIVNINQIKTIERNRIVFGKVYIPVSDSYKDRFAEMLEKRSIN